MSLSSKKNQMFCDLSTQILLEVKKKHISSMSSKKTTAQPLLFGPNSAMDYTCFLPMIITVLLTMLPPFMASAELVMTNISTDQAALLVLKSHITNINEPDNILATNWSTSSSFCYWIGVTCDAHHHRVTALDLSYKHLAGIIPPHLGNLSFLTELRFRNNSFQGSLPRELAQLHRLKWISFAGNNLSGDIPSWFGWFPKLQGLNLDRNQFSGSIPTSLFNSSSLQIIDLSDNQLSGSIPREIGNLTMLKKLRLDQNKFIEAPEEIGNIKLEVLQIQYNALTGPIPLFTFNISSLKVLAYTNNDLSGSIPDNICKNLPALKGLFLSHNQLAGNLPSQWSQCEELLELSLSFNHFTGSIPRNVGNLTNLQMLYFSFNNLTGTIPQEIGNLQSLVELGIQTNHMNGPIPFEMFNISTIEAIRVIENQLSGNFPSTTAFLLPNLKELLIGVNEFSGDILNFISNASQLIQLDAPYNSFSGLLTNPLGASTTLRWLGLSHNNLKTDSSNLNSFFSYLAQFDDLRRLDLSYNPLNAILPDSIGNLPTSLQYFAISNCNMVGSIPKDIGNLIGLTMLRLNNNELTGLIPKSIGRLHKLQGLYLNDNKLEGFILSEICQLMSLGDLYLANNKLFGPIPTCLGNLISLRRLFLNSNELSSTIPTTFWGLKDILKLNLSSNSLTGSLHSDMGSLKVVITIDLSNNHLSGNIPSTIEGLQALATFSLAKNRFLGSLPDSFGKLISLEFLDLSRNNLSGVIPKSMETISSLKYFNVSFNELQGGIPTEGPFAYLSGQSFMGNDALCGESRLAVPPCKTLEPQISRRKAIHILKYVLPAITSATLVLVLGIFLLKKYRKHNVKTASEDNFLPLMTMRKIPYRQLLYATDGFCERNLLGTGSFGSVYKGKLNNGMAVAIKVFNLERKTALTSFNSECEVLFNLRQRNLIKIINIHSSINFKALVLEYMPSGSLEKLLHSHNCSLNMLQRLNIMTDVASALEYLHHGYSPSLVHCDIKPSNILLDDDMVAHVADFGIAKVLGKMDTMVQTRTLGTIGYMAPEYGLVGIASTNGDVYSYGILLMETFTKRKPTDEMFVGDLSLRKWVKESLSHEGFDVMGASLLMGENANLSAIKDCLSSVMILALSCSAELPQERKSMNVMGASLLMGENANLSAIKDCLSSVMILALSCSAELPQERKSMKDVSVALHKIKMKLLKEVQ